MIDEMIEELGPGIHRTANNWFLEIEEYENSFKLLLTNRVWGHHPLFGEAITASYSNGRWYNHGHWILTTNCYPPRDTAHRREIERRLEAALPMCLGYRDKNQKSFWQKLKFWA